MRRQTGFALLIGAMSLPLAACGGSGGTAEKTPTSFAPGSSSTVTSPVSTSAVVDGGPCSADQLTGTQTTRGYLGTEVGYITLVNSTNRSCSMTGYAGFTPIGSNGASLPVNVVHREGLNCTPPAGFCTRPGMGPPSKVTLRPGDEAFFGFTYPGNPPTGPDGTPYPCDQGVATSVRPPDQTGTVMAEGAIDPCGPDFQVTISPVYSGSAPD